MYFIGQLLDPSQWDYSRNTFNISGPQLLFNIADKNEITQKDVDNAYKLLDYYVGTVDDINEENYMRGNFEIKGVRAKYQYTKLDNSDIKTQAMDSMKSELGKISFDTEPNNENGLKHPIAYTFMFIQWEAHRVMSHELIRNLSLTFATIAIVSLTLIANLQVCILVLLSVVFTLINVCGYAYYMGLTIETCTSIILILTAGLALDFAAHVGVIFACFKTGTRQTKMRLTLENIGPAVLNGGISTFLAFVILAFSETYVFQTFFKMFGMVVMFGLFNGLIFLPVLLSLIGPESFEPSFSISSNI